MLGNLKIKIFYCVLLAVGLAARFAAAKALPVFQVQRRQATINETVELAEKLFGPDDYNVTYFDERYIVLSPDGTKRIEFDTVSGGIWAADESEIWNTEGPAPELPSDSDAITMADALIAKLDLLPNEGEPVKVSRGRISGTFLAHECETGNGSGVYERQQYPLDVSVNYDIIMSISCQEFPLIGGGAKFKVTFGSYGKLIAFQGLWREIVGQTLYNMTPQAEADAFYLASTGYLNGTVTFQSIIAYYSQPFGNFQKTLSPLYVYTGTSQLQNQNITLRPEATRGFPPYTVPTHNKRLLDHRVAHHARSTDDNILEAATEWLGKPYNLMLSQQNAEGFSDGILAATPGWTIKYDRSDEDVLESDFTSDDDSYADSVDMLFYTGHANMNGWLANKPGNTTGVPELVDYTSFRKTPESPGDSLGEQDLKWLMIAACGPHQHEMFDPSAGNVFDRWRGIFDGLHTMFAYGSESYDSFEEGARFTKYSIEGNRLIDSWFRMAKEAQPSNVIVTAMWVDGPGGNARNDHLPGYGWVSGDNLGSPQCRWFMWTNC